MRGVLSPPSPTPSRPVGGKDLTSRPVRFQTVRNYLIAYAPDEEPLPVLSVLDGRRSPPRDRGHSSWTEMKSPNRNKYQLVCQTARHRFSKHSPRFLFLASQASDVGSIPIARSISLDDSVAFRQLSR